MLLGAGLKAKKARRHVLNGRNAGLEVSWGSRLRQLGRRGRNFGPARQLRRSLFGSRDRLIEADLAGIQRRSPRRRAQATGRHPPRPC